MFQPELLVQAFIIYFSIQAFLSGPPTLWKRLVDVIRPADLLATFKSVCKYTFLQVYSLNF